MHLINESTCTEGSELARNVFCFPTLADTEKGTVYTDATQSLTVRPFK